MILEILAVGMIVSACLALFLEEAVYSVAALAGTFMCTAFVYLLNGAVYVAIFQFAVGVGTLAILFLSGEMLSDKPTKKTSPKSIAALIGGGIILSLPAFFFPVSGTSEAAPAGVTFGEALWNLRAVDVALQGLVILIVATGIAIVLYEKRGAKK
jgi:NADH:ubiquinone oxidoreductase subunit 6 (subunit J)